MYRHSLNIFLNIHAESAGFSVLAAGLTSTRQLNEKSMSPDHSDGNVFGVTSTFPVANVSFLTHSWLHYSPPVISSEAQRVAVLHEGKALTPKSDKKATRLVAGLKQAAGETLSQVQTAAVAGVDKSFDRLTSSMRNYFNSIREVTNNFIRSPTLRENSTELISSNGRQTGARSVSSNISLYDFKDAIEEYEHELQNESVRLFNGSPVVGSSPIASSTGSAKECGITSHKNDTSSSVKIIAETVDDSVSEATEKMRRQELYDSPLVLSQKSKHLSTFLHAHRPALMLRLMCVINIRSVNHENICCINSTLLIFIFAHRM